MKKSRNLELMQKTNTNKQQQFKGEKVTIYKKELELLKKDLIETKATFEALVDYIDKKGLYQEATNYIAEQALIEKGFKKK